MQIDESNKDFYLYPIHTVGIMQRWGHSFGIHGAYRAFDGCDTSYYIVDDFGALVPDIRSFF